jgi:3-oxoacyl-[acyl-carrier-protein] synthase-1
VQTFDREYPVGIVGLGARTPVGLTARSTAAAVRAGISALGRHPWMVDKEGEPMVVARDAVLPPELDGIERFWALLEPAIREAVEPLREVGPASLEVFLGLPEPRPGLPADLGQALARTVERAPITSVHVDRVTVLPRGHAAGLLALEAAWRGVLERRIDLGLVGGVDTYLTAETLEGLDAADQLKSGANRGGFPPGEGAGFCLVASKTAMARLRLRASGWVIAAASAVEPNRIKTDTVCIGKGLSHAIGQAASVLRLPEERVDSMICDLNGERYRSEEFTYTVLRTQMAFVDFTDFMTPADCWGDVGAASGPLFVNLAAASGVRGYAHGPRIMLWAGSEGGDRGAALLDVGRFEGGPSCPR